MRNPALIIYRLFTYLFNSSILVDSGIVSELLNISLQETLLITIFQHLCKIIFTFTLLVSNQDTVFQGYFSEFFSSQNLQCGCYLWFICLYSIFRSPYILLHLNYLFIWGVSETLLWLELYKMIYSQECIPRSSQQPWSHFSLLSSLFPPIYLVSGLPFLYFL